MEFLAGDLSALELAKQLHARGDDVIATCRTASDALSTAGVEVESGVEVTSADSLQDLKSRLGDRRIDQVIVNAGIMRRTPIDGLDFNAIEESADYFQILFFVGVGI